MKMTNSRIKGQERAAQANCLPCPFCGDLPEVYRDWRAPENGFELFHHNSSCVVGRAGARLAASATLEAISYSWNKRRETTIILNSPKLFRPGDRVTMIGLDGSETQGVIGSGPMGRRKP